MNGPRELTLQEVETYFNISLEEESVVGHFATDEPELDRKQEAEIQRRSENDPWAWFTAKVEVHWNGFVGVDTLGCCSYASEKDFLEDDYYQDMVQQALDDLNRQVCEAWTKIQPLLS